MRLRPFYLLVMAGLAMLSAPVTARTDVLVTIDKSTQRMTVTVDGVQRYVWPVSTGGPDYDTPSGEFTPFRMEKDHFSREWDDAPMPNSIFFTKIGHAIHGTFEGRNLGRPVSHGCVRLSRANAEALFALVKKEGLNSTRVVLDGRIPDNAATPTVATRKPLDLNASSYERPVRALGGQRLRDDDDGDALSAEESFRGYRPYPDYRGYRAPRPSYNRGQLPFPFPFLFDR